ncbi:tyrosine-type recombinase/integrase [Pseudomonas putida]|uniref:tyrosine-type recombinase/integrase n=1 Tax=Pseudomonas putida TaxID=303 RepID=UPI00155443AD|nr:tyrosine-type recombinase/integrase [Pseudomonas putida]
MSIQKDRDSYAQSLLDEFERDIQESVNAELESMLKDSVNDHIPKGGHLALMLESTDGNFPISTESFYNDTIWRFPRNPHFRALSVSFNHETEGANILKRALAFYMLPEYNHTYDIKSYKSTVSYANKFSLLEKYIFIENNITAKPHCLHMVSETMINDALDRARDYDNASNYTSLFSIIKLWASLSTHELIPPSLRLDVPLNKIVVPERRAEIAEKLRATLQPWVPYSEEDLSHMMEYAFFWIEKATPELAKVEPTIENVYLDNKQGKISRNKPDLELESNFEVKAGGRIVMQATRHAASSPTRKEYWRYTWKSDWAVALDNVRNAVFILIALITGARASELAPLSISDITNDRPDGSGEYWIRIVRWKTADDPNYNGEVEFLPLPRFVAESAIAYDKLRNIGRRSKRHWLFQSNKTGSSNELEAVTPQLLAALIRQLKELLPIERIHAHRFRKTIAEILINQDERNLDLIRALFGHKSFNMTLKYIARNPAMVRSVALSLEMSYTNELQDIVQAIRMGAYSGKAAIRISEQIAANPEDFVGKKIQISLLEYVTNLLMGGHPLFIKRTAVGTYCVTAEHFKLDNLPPCIQGRDFDDEIPRPDPTNCHYDCRKIVVLDKAKSSLEQNIIFYQRILDNPKANLPAATSQEIVAKIESYQYHLSHLEHGNLHRHNADFAEPISVNAFQTNRISAVNLHD